MTYPTASLYVQQMDYRRAAALFFLVALPGSAQLTTAGNVQFQQEADGIIGNRESNDLFGRALVGCDFDGNGIADLAIGSPGESNARGIVNVIYADEFGVTSQGNETWE